MKYTYEQEKVTFLIDNVKGISLEELTNKFNENFGTNLSKSSISNMKRKLGLTSGVNTRFKKGQTSWNKGRKMSKQQYEKCKQTMFKKGNKTYNIRNLFEERKDKDGYIKIKVENPNKWVLKHRYIYEKVHGKIPEGHKVMFADGDIYNFDLDNLILVSYSELLIMNKRGLCKKDKELTKIGANIAKVLDSVSKRKE